MACWKMAAAMEQKLPMLSRSPERSKRMAVLSLGGTSFRADAQEVPKIWKRLKDLTNLIIDTVPLLMITRWFESIESKLGVCPGWEVPSYNLAKSSEQPWSWRKSFGWSLDAPDQRRLRQCWISVREHNIVSDVGIMRHWYRKINEAMSVAIAGDVSVSIWLIWYGDAWRR